MTADERIEKLLNRFGQTISDLPKPDKRKKLCTYDWYTKLNLDKAARKWEGVDNYFSWNVVGDYACHLCDVIDRLEIALETAAKCVSCIPCVNAYSYCNGSCDFRIDDKYMSDVSEEDTKRYIDDAE